MIASNNTGILAIYRKRDDGDADLIAAFDRQNCEGFFQCDNDGGADEVARLIECELGFDGEDTIRIEFDNLSEVVEVLDLTSNKEKQ